jgi:hypothetical protein
MDVDVGAGLEETVSAWAACAAPPDGVKVQRTLGEEVGRLEPVNTMVTGAEGLTVVNVGATLVSAGALPTDTLLGAETAPEPASLTARGTVVPAVVRKEEGIFTARQVVVEEEPAQLVGVTVCVLGDVPMMIESAVAKYGPLISMVTFDAPAIVADGEREVINGTLPK